MIVVREERTRAIPVEEPYDLASTMFPIRRGTGDPTMRIEQDGVARSADARRPGHSATGAGRRRSCARPGGDRRRLGARARARADRRGRRPVRVRAARRRDGRSVEAASRRPTHARAGRGADPDRGDPRAEGRGDGGAARVAAHDARRERTGARRRAAFAPPRARDADRASVLPVPPVGGGATPRGSAASRVCAGGVARGARRRPVRPGGTPARGVARNRSLDDGRGHAAVVRRSRRGLGRRLPPA